MIPTHMLVTVGISLTAGMIGAIVGIGGGFLIVPILIFIFGLSAQVSAGTSLIALVFTALSGTVGYTWQRRIDYKLGLSLAVASAPGAVLGSIASTYLTSRFVITLFGCFMILVSVYIVVGTPRISSGTEVAGWRRRVVDRGGKEFEYSVRHFVLAYPLVFLAGVIAGFFGIGGGALQVPVMIMLLGIPAEIATATSALMIVVSGLTGALTHIQLGSVAYEFTPFIVISVIVGAQICVQVQRLASSLALRRLFALSVIIIGLRMILVMLI